MNKLYWHIKVGFFILPWYLSIFWVVQLWIDERLHATILSCWRYLESAFSSFFSQRTLVVELFLFLVYLLLKFTVAEDHQLIDSWYRSYKKNMMSFTKESLQQVKYHTIRKPVLNSFISLPGINLKAQAVTWHRCPDHNAQILTPNFLGSLACTEWRKYETLSLFSADQ